MKETLVTQAKVLEDSKSFLKQAEESLDALLGPQPIHSTLEVRLVASLLFEAQRLVHAYRNWPTFDPGCLALMREDKALGIFVPTLAFDSITRRGSNPVAHSESWSPMAGSRLFYDGPPCAISVVLPEHLIARNRQILTQVRVHSAECDGFTLTPSRKNPPTEATVDRNRLTALAPPIPAGVAERILAAEGEFDCMKLVWEAEWKGDPVKDPLVIGLLRGRCFLVDQYDATKVERYIMSEMCQKKRD